MTENRFAEQLAAKLRIRFATTADGTRCEAAAILTRDGHEQYSRYVSSWGNEDPNLSEEFRAEAPDFAGNCPSIRQKICDDAILLLPGADRNVIGASSHVFLRDRSLWLGGENMLFGWKPAFTPPPGTLGANFWRHWRLFTLKCPRERRQPSGFSRLSREFGINTQSARPTI
jgi:hypothetical protein